MQADDRWRPDGDKSDKSPHSKRAGCLQLSKAAPEATPTSNCTGGKVNRLRVAGLSE